MYPCDVGFGLVEEGTESVLFRKKWGYAMGELAVRPGERGGILVTRLGMNPTPDLLSS